jgi:apolipoprotein N-acyltransferase
LFRNVLLHDRGAGAAAPAISIPVATGIVLSDKRAGLSRDVNSFVLGDSSGRVLGRYDKQRLVPLGESSSAALGAISGSLGGFVPGDDSPGLSLGPRRIATVLCFEALDSELVRRAMQHGTANLLLNPSSDAWFADSPGPSLHLALAKIRAIEHARYLLRPTTNGISALVDPAGRVVWSLPPDRAATGVATAHWLSSVTPFTLIDATWPMYIASLLCGIAVMSRLRRGRAWFRRNAGPV